MFRIRFGKVGELTLLQYLELILMCIFEWNVPNLQKRGGIAADLVFGHEFGDQEHLSGTSKRIALNVYQVALGGHTPYVLQHPDELAFNRDEFYLPLGIIKEHKLKPGTYLDTEEVQRQVVDDYCKPNGWQKVALGLHWGHAWRSGLNMIHHGRTPVHFDNSNVWADIFCSRWALKSELVWLPRESFAKYKYFEWGYISVEDVFKYGYASPEKYPHLAQKFCPSF